jgi:hypothetical protein
VSRINVESTFTKFFRREQQKNEELVHEWLIAYENITVGWD